jgi:hypothetical protein
VGLPPHFYFDGDQFQPRMVRERQPIARRGPGGQAACLTPPPPPFGRIEESNSRRLQLIGPRQLCLLLSPAICPPACSQEAHGGSGGGGAGKGSSGWLSQPDHH